MYRLFYTLVIIGLLPVFSFSQIQGDWYGKLNLGVRLPVVLHLQEVKKNKYEATLDSPSQKAFGIKVDEVKVKKNTIYLKINSITSEYSGELIDGELRGTFKQFGQPHPLTFSRDSSVIAPPKRSQEINAPFPYESKDVVFKNEKDGVNLAGTFTYPSTGDNFKAVILVTGSGPQDRNEEMLGHKTFLVIADYLTRNGIAVLRYDDRGVGKSTGNFANSTIHHFRNDAEAAIQFLKNQTNVNSSQIGVVGHSEGGMIAQMLATDANRLVDFAVLLASPGVPLDELMIRQNEDILSESMTAEEIDEYIKAIRPIYAKIKEDPKCDVTCILAMIQANFKDYNEKVMQYMGLAQQLGSDWFGEFLRFNPNDYLSTITVPVLALNGSKDVQVHGDMNLKAISLGLEKVNSNFKTILYEDMNHLFQPSKTGAISEYEEIEITFSERVLEDITNWIKKL